MKRTVIAIKNRISQKLSEIDAADYIFFMDGEDYMSVDCIRLISDMAEEYASDIIFADMLCHNHDG